MGLEIVAALAISLSEIQTVDSSITEEWIKEYPTKFKMILYHLGMDIENPIEQQDCTHRNRFGNVITCPRWVGNERIDKDWIEGEYASYEAIAKASRNKILIDIFRLRGMTEYV